MFYALHASYAFIKLTGLTQRPLSPTPRHRAKLVRESRKQFQKSDESAYSIIPSQMSSQESVPFSLQTMGQRSSRNDEDMTYQPLSFEDDLFTARVYKRNYRPLMALGVSRTKSRDAFMTPEPRHKTRQIQTKRFCDNKNEDSQGLAYEDSQSEGFPRPYPSETSIEPRYSPTAEVVRDRFSSVKSSSTSSVSTHFSNVSQTGLGIPHEENVNAQDSFSAFRPVKTFIDSQCVICEEPLGSTLKNERILEFSCKHSTHEACFHKYCREFQSGYDQFTWRPPLKVNVRLLNIGIV